MMPADTFLVPAGHSPWTVVLLILCLSVVLWAPIYYVSFRVPSLCKRRRGRLTLVALVTLVPALSVAGVLKLGEVVPPPRGPQTGSGRALRIRRLRGVIRLSYDPLRRHPLLPLLPLPEGRSPQCAAGVGLRVLHPRQGRVPGHHEPDEDVQATHQ